MLMQQAAIGQSGQWVMTGHMPELFVLVKIFGDVIEDGDLVGSRAVGVPHCIDTASFKKNAAILPPAPHFPFPFAFAEQLLFKVIVMLAILFFGK